MQINWKFQFLEEGKFYYFFIILLYLISYYFLFFSTLTGDGVPQLAIYLRRMKEALENGLNIPPPPPLAQAITQPPPLPDTLIDPSLEEVDIFENEFDDHEFDDADFIIDDDEEDDDEFLQISK